MTWTPDKIEKLKKLWGSGISASQIATRLEGMSRNAVIGKAHRLNLSAKISRTKKNSTNHSVQKNNERIKSFKKTKFKSMIIEKNFEPENPKQLEDLNDHNCKWPIGHPNESNFYFCGRTSLKDFSYCKLHLLYAFQPKAKKEDIINKEDGVPKFIEKKIKSA